MSESVPNGFRRSPGANWGRPVSIAVEGIAVESREGECLVSALAVAGHIALRSTTAGKRGMFCLMGICQECVVVVDGVRQPACMTTVRDGMDVRLVEEPGR